VLPARVVPPALAVVSSFNVDLLAPRYGEGKTLPPLSVCSEPGIVPLAGMLNTHQPEAYVDASRPHLRTSNNDGARRRRDQHLAPMVAPPTSSPARYRLGFQPALLRPELPAGNRLFRLHDEEIAVRAVAEDTFEELIPVKGDHDVLRPPTPA
jgi:hypothetical protein